MQVLVSWPGAEPLPPGVAAVVESRRVDLDAAWQAAPYDPASQALGPFAVGETVAVRTRVTNAAGHRVGTPKTWTLTEPTG